MLSRYSGKVLVGNYMARRSQLVREKETAPHQLMTRFASVQLQLHAMTEFGIGEVAQNVDGLYHAAECRESSRQPVRRGGVGESLNDDIRRGRPVFERSRYPDHEVPLLPDQVAVGHSMQQRVEASVVGLPAHLINVLVGEIAQPGHEGITEQITQSKNMLREAMRVRVVLAEACPNQPPATWDLLRSTLDEGFRSIDRRLQECGPLQPERFSLSEANERLAELQERGGLRL